MPRLPNAERAIVDAEKLRGYVLSTAHPVGRFKAAFFKRLGYSADNSKLFEQQLRGMVRSTEVGKVEETRFGRKYVIEGPLVGPSGETVQVVSVWVILNAEDIPRLVTVYPGGSI